MDECRTCLSSGSDDFFGLMAQTITQLFVSCTNAGGGVTSDGESLCASNAMFELCTSLKDGSSGESSWASYEKSGSESEREYGERVLDITDPEAAAPQSSSEPTAPETTASVSASGTAAPKTTESASVIGTGTGAGSAATTTGGPSPTGTTTPSLAGIGWPWTLGRADCLGLCHEVGAGAQPS